VDTVCLSPFKWVIYVRDSCANIIKKIGLENELARELDNQKDI